MRTDDYARLSCATGLGSAKPVFAGSIPARTSLSRVGAQYDIGVVSDAGQRWRGREPYWAGHDPPLPGTNPGAFGRLFSGPMPVRAETDPGAIGREVASPPVLLGGSRPALTRDESRCLRPAVFTWAGHSEISQSECLTKNNKLERRMSHTAVDLARWWAVLLVCEVCV